MWGWDIVATLHGSKATRPKAATYARAPGAWGGPGLRELALKDRQWVLRRGVPILYALNLRRHEMFLAKAIGHWLWLPPGNTSNFSDV